ncbi:MAG: glycoside hydrolase family 2 TIM barrel-domain containing protein [Clostridia bacterium]|nr:glycoside hydrolase family 2 TIM barrel-domain containing protein [Clostridia bacterium]
MKRMDFCQGWTYRIWGVPGDTPVTLPHDYSQELPRTPDSKSGSAGGWFQGANIIYDKEIQVTEAMLSQRVMLEFEGVMPGAEVYLDDTLIVRQPYGYVSFLADLTPYLRKGTQKIRVNVHGDALPNSRWYAGTGICRPVHLLQGPKACILPWGLSAKPGWEPEAGWVFQAETTLSPEAAQRELTLRLQLRGPDGALLWQTEEPACAERMQVLGGAAGIRPWTPEAPILYCLSAELLNAGEMLDRAETRFGFRCVQLDQEKGLLLNGEPIKLRGGCVHHDHGLLGAASLRDAEYRKARILKDFGYNAVRCAHNPPAPAFLDACDDLGLLVMDEFTDIWNIGKNPYDYHLFFRDHWKRDLESMIQRDRNHPSVILWSIGNEIPERDGSGDGYALCGEMCRFVREMDDTRLIAAALNNIGKRRLDMLAANVQTDDPDSLDYFGILSEKYLAPLDVAGYNYLSRRYEQDLAAYPARFICGTESVAKEALECWRKTREHPRIIGDFAWAAIDYLGEAGIGHVWYKPEDGEGFFEKWPWRQANCADIDLNGHINPAGYYRQAVWGTLEKPYIAVQHPGHFHEDGDVSYWAWPERFPVWEFPGYEGKPVQVDVYSAEKAVTLYLNGKAVATKPCRDCIASFDLRYEPGELEADDGKGRVRLCTPGPAAALRWTAEKSGELVYVTAQITDEEGSPCFFDTRFISFSAENCALLSAGSADPASQEDFRQGGARAWRGAVSAAVRLNGKDARVLAAAPGLPPAEIIL